MAQALVVRSKKLKPVIDIVWVLWFLVAFFVFLYLTTYVDIDPVLSDKGVIGFCILGFGTLFTHFFIGFNVDKFISEKEAGMFLGMVAVSFVAVLFVNWATMQVSTGLSFTPINQSLFLMLIGMAEETVFRGLLLNLILVWTGDFITAIFVSSLVGASTHAAVYGMSFELMFIVFGSFVVLGFAYVFSGRRLSTTMTAHGLYNLMVVIAGG